MAEDWQKLDPERAARVLSDINPFIQPVPFSAESAAVRAYPLSFYRGYEIVELTDLSAVPAARKYALYKSGEVSVVDWTNAPIYAVNKVAPIILNERSVIDYVKFFFSYVRGRHGRFMIIEAVDDIRWQVEPPPQGRKVMQDILSPVSLIAHEGDDAFTLEACVLFKDSLFKTRIHVREDGFVGMSDEELKIESMPVLQDTAA